MGFKGIDVRQTGDRVNVRAFLLDSAGAIVTSGTTNLRAYEFQSDGTLKSYDWNDNSFKTTALTTENQAMTHRTGNNGSRNTGIWTFAITTLTNWTVGATVFFVVENSGASPTCQVHQIEFGSAEGDIVVTSSKVEAQVKGMDANTVDSTSLADNAITANKIATSAITNTKFAAGAIDAAALATDAITGSKIAANAIGATQIADDAIDSGALATSAITEIQSGLATAAALNTVDDFLDTEIAAIKAKTDNLPSDPADASDIASAFSTVNSTLATIAGYLDTEISAIKTVTDAIGATGTGLSAIPWNAAWDAEVQSEVNDALVAINLDHLLAVAAVAGDVVNSSIIARLTSKSATPAFTSFDNTTDSLEAIKDAGAGSGATAQQVWDYLLSGSVGAGSAGAALAAAGTAGDPWITALPGSYAAGTAGYILGNGIASGGAGLLEVTQGTITNANLSAGWVLITTLTAPASGSIEYQLDILLTSGLTTSHQIEAKRVTSGVDYPEGAVRANGATADTMGISYKMTAGDAAIAVYLRDTEAGSTAVNGHWDLYDSVGATTAVATANAAQIAALLSQRVNLVLNSTYDGGEINFVNGDEWLEASGTALHISKAASETWPTTLTTVHFTCEPTQTTLDRNPSAVGLTDIACVVVTPTGSAQEFYLELTEAQQATLEKGDEAYEWWFYANQATVKKLLRKGLGNVIRSPATYP